MKFVEKPWGSEKIILLDNIVLKELFMKCGFKCSLQYHQFKNEIIRVVSGKLKFSYSPNIDTALIDMELNPGDFYAISHGMIHRMEALEDSIYIEASSNELDDVIRLEDSYGRI